MIPTIIFLGVLYASVSTRFIFFRIFKNSRHMTEHTLTGWSTWAGILRESPTHFRAMLLSSRADTNYSDNMDLRLDHCRSYSILLIP